MPSRIQCGHLPMTEAELITWGESLGRDAHPPMIITLVGELGAGKTTLAQAICRGYGVVDEVTSPTYALVHEYTAPKSLVYHIDLYRLQSEDELNNIGWDELVATHALILVEWPERAMDRLPSVHVPIMLDYLPGDSTRRVLLAG